MWMAPEPWLATVRHDGADLGGAGGVPLRRRTRTVVVRSSPDSRVRWAARGACGGDRLEFPRPPRHGGAGARKTTSRAEKAEKPGKGATPWQPPPFLPFLPFLLLCPPKKEPVCFPPAGCP